MRGNLPPRALGVVGVVGVLGGSGKAARRLALVSGTGNAGADVGVSEPGSCAGDGGITSSMAGGEDVRLGVGMAKGPCIIATDDVEGGISSS